MRNAIRFLVVMALLTLQFCSNPVDANRLLPPEGLTATALSSTTVQVSWGAAQGALFYNVYAGTSPESVLLITHTSSISWIDTPQSSGGLYYYRVQSVNDNEASIMSAPASVLIAPAPPETLHVEAGNASATIRWSPHSTDSAIICISIDSSIAAGTPYDSSRAPSSPYTVTNLTNDRKYWLSVRSVAGSMISARSRALPVIPRALLPVTVGMKLIPQGTFTMGTMDSVVLWGTFTMQTFNSPTHQVTLSSFYMDSTEVTQNDYLQIMGHNPSKANGSVAIGSGAYDNGSSFLRAVDNVSWYDAVLFCNARSELAGLDTVYSYSGVTPVTGFCPGPWDAPIPQLSNVIPDYTKNGYRLPTEAEWEYACRGNATTVFYWGDDSAVGTISQYEWSTHTGDGQWSFPVAQKKPNPFGLYDMIGNMNEWCNDWFAPYSAGQQTNPAGPAGGSGRVIRGPGGMNSFAYFFYDTGKWRSSGRLDQRFGGFRCVRSAM